MNIELTPLQVDAVLLSLRTTQNTLLETAAAIQRQAQAQVKPEPVEPQSDG